MVSRVKTSVRICTSIELEYNIKASHFWLSTSSAWDKLESAKKTAMETNKWGRLLICAERGSAPRSRGLGRFIMLSLHATSMFASSTFPSAPLCSSSEAGMGAWPYRKWFTRHWYTSEPRLRNQSRRSRPHISLAVSPVRSTCS